MKQARLLKRIVRQSRAVHDGHEQSEFGRTPVTAAEQAMAAAQLHRLSQVIR
jgi:hypothetical protein